MERIVVSDTNIFIDLVKLSILPDLFSLPWEIHTTDFVMNELVDTEQFSDVNSFRENGRLTVGKHSAEEVQIIFNESGLPGCRLSPTDLSVALYAHKNNFSILTGDKRLKDYAQKEGIEVHGILFLFEAMVDNKIIPPDSAINLLTQLQAINKWLPSDIIEKMIQQWSQR